MKNYSFYQLILLAFSLFFLHACSPFTKVYSVEEPGANLYKYHTFNWLEDEETQAGNKGPEWLTDKTQTTIRNSVEHQMSQYGFKVCTEKPDLMLHYHVVIENKLLYVRDRSCETHGDIQFGRCNRLRAVHYQEGTLIVDFIDTQSSNQVWRGVAVGVLENMRPDEVGKRIEKAVQVIFEKFPEQRLPNQFMR